MARRGSLAYIVLIVALTLVLGGLMYGVMDGLVQPVQDHEAWMNKSYYESDVVADNAYTGQRWMAHAWKYTPIGVLAAAALTLIIASRRGG